jgi:hypothetical protein
MTRTKTPLEVGLAALMLAGMLVNAAWASSPESSPAVGSASRALSPGTTLPSNVTHPTVPPVPGVIIAPPSSDPVIPSPEPVLSPDIPDLPWRRIERLK